MINVNVLIDVFSFYSRKNKYAQSMSTNKGVLQEIEVFWEL